jgi:hypothetical protein
MELVRALWIKSRCGANTVQESIQEEERPPLDPVLEDWCGTADWEGSVHV